ncbi:Hint domain-containing protein [Caulobacter sp.]|uniref:Hint domain-containing protein n=1 Tax=Caulobacter sp. TaxID=78 RepID=UPI002B47F2D8|nr:Hint domain-containing protein [Caulobacter sp.]HJV40104.1 Hint domain-containing protein [Caulobacter sp.]
MISSSNDQVDAIFAAAKAGQDGVTRALNPADPVDVRAIRAFLTLSGKTPDTHPGLFGDLQSLSEGRASAADATGHVLQLVDYGRDAQGRATARAWYIDQAGAHMAGSVALVLDADTGAPLARGYANKVGGGLCPAATRSDAALPASDKITAVGFYHSQSHPEAPPAFGLVAKTTQLAAFDMPQATVTAPVSATHASVKIALGRPSPSVDADYVYSQDTTDNPPLLVPFTGTVDTQQPLANVGAGGQFTSGLSLTTQLYSLNGAAYIAGAAPDPTKVTGDTTSNIVTWSYPFDPAHTSPTNTPSLIYGTYGGANNNIDWTSHNETAFYFEFLIPVANPVAPSYQFNVCSTDWPEQPSVNCVQIKPLEFWWHCLAEGTLVTLADGTTQPIEAVGNTARVRTGQGGDLGVEATTRGLHHIHQPNVASTGVYRLTTEGGRSLVLTGGHPVATGNGFVRACDLAAGDSVLTEAGLDAVAKLEPDAFAGVFANLKLIDETDRAKGLAGAVGTFIANGVVVGDHAAFRQSHYLNSHSLEYMRGRIPERYHTDYASTLATIHADNRRYGGAF